jgi:hypothetical protein
LRCNSRWRHWTRGGEGNGKQSLRFYLSSGPKSFPDCVFSKCDSVMIFLWNYLGMSRNIWPRVWKMTEFPKFICIRNRVFYTPRSRRMRIPHRPESKIWESVINHCRKLDFEWILGWTVWNSSIWIHACSMSPFNYLIWESDYMSLYT